MNLKRFCWLITAIVSLSILTPAAFATDPMADWCKNVNIVFFPGGPAGRVFAVNVYNGADRRSTTWA